MKKKRKATKPFSKGFKWGRVTTRKHFDDEGELGLRKADKMATTCNKYASDKKLEKNKAGRSLNYPLRQYYKGIFVGSLYEYNAITVYGKNKRSKQMN